MMKMPKQKKKTARDKGALTYVKCFLFKNTFLDLVYTTPIV